MDLDLFKENSSLKRISLLYFFGLIILLSACDKPEPVECGDDGSGSNIRFRPEGYAMYIKNYHNSRPISVRFQLACLPSLSAGSKTITIEPGERKLAYYLNDDTCNEPSKRGHVSETVCTWYDL